MFEKMIGSVNSEGRLSYFVKFSYGVGHIFNDLCSAMWFSYLLVFFEKVLQFNPTKAGIMLLIGQLADGFSTPVVGIFSDKENKITSCANYGRRKVWHLAGTILTALSFPFIFVSCLICTTCDENIKVAYYCVLIVVFQFGWACVQIAHLALIPELAHKKSQRTELNSIRYGFAILSSLSVYSVAFFLLETGPESAATTITIVNETFNFMENGTITLEDFNTLKITPNDSYAFRDMALSCIILGLFFSAVFHFGVKEPPFNTEKNEIDDVVNSNDEIEKDSTMSLAVQKMKNKDWFREIAFYQVALLYVSTRIFVNVYQVYIPLYVQDSLHLSRTAVATVPFTIYLAGLLVSIVMKPINKRLGRKATFSLGCCIGLVGCAWIGLDLSENFRIWGIYCAAALLGSGGSTLLITSLSITADLIGSNVEGSAFVYGIMSLVDKFGNGIVIMIVQNNSVDRIEFYQQVVSYTCGSACLLGLLTCLTLIPIKVSERRGNSKSIEEFNGNSIKSLDITKKTDYGGIEIYKNKEDN